MSGRLSPLAAPAFRYFFVGQIVELGCFALAVSVAAVALTRRRITDVRLTGARPPELVA